MITTTLYGIEIRRDNPKTGVFQVRSINDQKSLLNSIATAMLSKNQKVAKSARTLAETIDRCHIQVNPEIFLKK
jgi:hypothetical protein